MMLFRLFTSARWISAASFLMALAGSMGCERAKSPPVIDSARSSATQVETASSTSPKPSAKSRERLIPESSAETMRAFAAAHLRPGLKPGDFLTNKADYPTGDTAGVYRAVLDTLYVSRDGFPGQVVLSDVAITQSVTCLRMPCPIIPNGTGSEPKLETLDAYRIAQLNRRHITPKFSYHIPLKLLGETEHREMEIDGRAIALRDSASLASRGMREMPFWLAFQVRYPHAWGYAVLSVVGMNPKRNEAILQVTHLCGTYCHSTETMVLWKVRGQWHVIERVPEEGDSTDLGHESLRYRGVGAHAPIYEIRAAAKRDSIRQAEIPRDIHGRITSQTGQPVQGAKITLHAGDHPNVPSAAAITDSLGDYRFANPPVGSAGLMVRCPGNTAHPDSLAKVAGTDVGIGQHVEVNIWIDRAICDETPGVAKPEQIAPAINVPPLQNAFDVARARMATYPSEDEAAVYRALLKQMGYGSAGITPVYAVTRSSCSFTSCRDVYLHAIRYEPQVMLSTMENFVAVRDQRLDFRTDFVGLPGMQLVGDSAIKAVERATGSGDALNNPDVIHRAWPNVDVIVSLSPVGFSPRREQAIVEVTRGDNRHGSLLGILNRTPSGWRVVRLVNFVGNND